MARVESGVVDLPSWIQAWGSVAGVAAAAAGVWAAFAVVKHFHRLERAREDAALAARREVVHLLLGRCKSALKRAKGKSSARSKTPFNLDNVSATEGEMDECIHALSTVDLMDLPDADAVKRLMGARYWMNVARRRVTRVRSKLEGGELPKGDEFDMPLRMLSDYCQFDKEPDVSALFER